MKLSVAKSTRKARTRRRKSGARYWVLSVLSTGAIIAVTIGSSHRMVVGYAEERNGNIEMTTLRDDENSIDFNIPAGPLSEVLEEFQKRSGLSVTIENENIRAIASPGVIGNYTPEAALKEILKGTGVSYAFRDARTVLLSIRAQGASVEVRGDGTAVLSSPKYPESLRTTPQTINVIPKEVIEQQAATTLRDALNNTPGITLNAGEGGGAPGDNITVRGFSARNDIFIDGVRDLGTQSRETFNLEQIEVVKGPSSTFTGRGSTGGAINLVSKLPGPRRSFAGTLMGGSDETRRATADVNLPFGDSVALRVNALAHDSHFPGRSDVQNRRFGIAPSIIFGLGSRTRYAVSYFHLTQNNTADYGIPWVPDTQENRENVLRDFIGRPAPVPRSTFYGIIDRDKERLRSDLFTFRFEHIFSDNLSLRNQFRYGYSRRDSIATPPRFPANTGVTSLSDVEVTRNVRSWLTDDDVFDNQTDFSARFGSPGFEHALVAGANISFEKQHRILRSAPSSPTTLLNPNPFDVYPGVITISPLEPEVDALSVAGYVFDTVKFGEKVQLVGGLRWDRFAVEGRNVSGSSFVPIDRTDTILSGRAAVVFTPIEIASLYASYSTSANPSFEGLLIAPANAELDPEKTRTFEAGTKWNLFADRLLFTGAFFRTDKTDARTTDTVTGIISLDGDVRVQGIEINGTGNITPNWQIFAGYTFIDSEIVSTGNPAELGKELANTPRNAFSLWTTYRWNKLFFGGGPRYVGERFGNNTNTRFVDAFWVADVMASYQLTKNFDLRVNLNNITDEYYIDRLGGGHVIPGAGRVVLVSTSFRF